MVQQAEKTERQQKNREKRELREAEAAAVLAVERQEADPEEVEDSTERPIEGDSANETSESPAGDSEGENANETPSEGAFLEDSEVIVVPPKFEVTLVEAVTARSSALVLEGETPVAYRGVIEFNPSRTGMKKNLETGTREIKRIEFFFSDPHVFYWLYSRVSRDMPDHTYPDVARAEAVALNESSAVIWRDRNPNEKE